MGKEEFNNTVKTAVTRKVNKLMKKTLREGGGHHLPPTTQEMEAMAKTKSQKPNEYPANNTYKPKNNKRRKGRREKETPTKKEKERNSRKRARTRTGKMTLSRTWAIRCSNK